MPLPCLHYNMRYASFKHFIDVSKSHKRNNAIFLRLICEYKPENTKCRGFGCNVSLRYGSHSVVSRAHVGSHISISESSPQLDICKSSFKFDMSLDSYSFSAVLYHFLSQIQFFVFLIFHQHFLKFETVSKMDDLQTCSTIRCGLTGTKVPRLIHPFKRRFTNERNQAFLHAIFDKLPKRLSFRLDLEDLNV